MRSYHGFEGQPGFGNEPAAKLGHLKADTTRQVGFFASHLRQGPSWEELEEEKLEKRSAGFIMPERIERTGKDWLLAFWRQPLVRGILIDLKQSRNSDWLQTAFGIKDLQGLDLELGKMNGRFLEILAMLATSKDWIPRLELFSYDQVFDGRTKSMSINFKLNRELLEKCWSLIRKSRLFTTDEKQELKSELFTPLLKSYANGIPAGKKIDVQGDSGNTRKGK